MTALVRKLHRVHFCETQRYAIDISAANAAQAIELAKTIRYEHGIDPFETMDGGPDDWHAYLVDRLT